MKNAPKNLSTRKKTTRALAWAALFATATGSVALAGQEQEYSFPKVWEMAKSHSPEISAARHEAEGAEIQSKRLSRHWYPKVSAEGRAFSTNDPAVSFMSLLGQRQIAPSDFAPTALNQPGSNVYERGTLGLDLPLFEGGARVAAADASEKMAEARKLELRSVETVQYAGLASAYASLLSLQEQRSELTKLSRGVGETLSRYSIGAKSNPVGYSGLLGLKTLRNRLDGLMLENAAKTEALRERVRVMAKGLPENWSPEARRVKEFLADYLSPKNEAAQSSPASVRAMSLVADSVERAAGAEKARFLPKIGLFGTGDLYNGSRATATSYTAGAYLQWELFSAPNFGAVAEKEHATAAAQARAESMSERVGVERAGARQSATALEKNLELMDASAGLLEEQTATARNLFRNGSINALQLVEVLSRRADLLVARADAEERLAEARATLIVNSGTGEVKNEN